MKDGCVLAKIWARNRILCAVVLVCCQITAIQGLGPSYWVHEVVVRLVHLASHALDKCMGHTNWGSGIHGGITFLIVALLCTIALAT